MQDDFKPGDPVRHVIGKPTEKPAKKHGPLPPKPKKRASKDAEQIRRSIQRRMRDIQPDVAEYARLQKAIEAIKDIK